MKKIYILLLFILFLLLGIFYLYNGAFGIFTKEKEQKIISYQGNFKEIDHKNINFNNTITSGVIVNI